MKYVYALLSIGYGFAGLVLLFALIEAGHWLNGHMHHHTHSK